MIFQVLLFPIFLPLFSEASYSAPSIVSKFYSSIQWERRGMYAYSILPRTRTKLYRLLWPSLACHESSLLPYSISQGSYKGLSQFKGRGVARFWKCLWTLSIQKYYCSQLWKIQSAKNNNKEEINQMGSQEKVRVRLLHTKCVPPGLGHLLLCCSCFQSILVTKVVKWFFRMILLKSIR